MEVEECEHLSDNFSDDRSGLRTSNLLNRQAGTVFPESQEHHIARTTQFLNLHKVTDCSDPTGHFAKVKGAARGHR